MTKYLLASAAALALIACSQQPPAEDAAAPAATEDMTAATEAEAAPAEEAAATPEALLDGILAAQPADVQARYQWRHPKETLAFFGVEPGMTVVEALPGGGWYSKILIPYLGAGGHLIGADYSVAMWPLFGGFATPEFVEGKKNWVGEWTTEAQGWCTGDCAAVSAFQFGSVPAEMAGTADVVLLIRALHNLARFEGDGAYMTQAINDAKTVLKPGGIVGVVQHRAPDSSPDEWASGAAGYLKQGAVIAAFEAAGFEYLGASEVNANPNDQPTTEDFVWRLPPTLGTSQDNPELKAQMEAIGESDRMTLKFRKPA